MDDRAIIFVGGSVRGIYQLGVLARILDENPDRTYKFLGGNSVGTLTAAFLGQYPIGQLAQGLIDLLKIWYGLKDGGDLWKINMFSILRALIDNGISNPRPLQKLIQDNFDVEKIKNSGRDIRISTVDVLDGRYVEYSEDQLTWQNIYGSTAMPFGCPAIETEDGKYLTDGGVLVSGPLKTAIKMGYRKIDLILNCPISTKKRVKRVEVKDVKRMDKFALRILGMILDNQFVQQMKMCMLYNLLAQNGLTDKVEVDVNIYAPSDVLASEMILMKLDPDQLRQWYEEGKATEPVDIETFLTNLG
jgi:predicted acylesterase/phospholipase RssA